MILYKTCAVIWQFQCSFGVPSYSYNERSRIKTKIKPKKSNTWIENHMHQVDLQTGKASNQLNSYNISDFLAAMNTQDAYYKISGTVSGFFLGWK